MTGPSVLIVEDELTLRGQMCAYARSLGFEVIEARDGEEGLAQLGTCTPDIIVTDLQMPRLDGRSFLIRLRELPAFGETPVLVVTANESRGIKIELFRVGADDFILKPFDPDEFQARLRALARRGTLASALFVAQRERDAALVRLEERNQELERLTLGLIVALEKANQFNDVDTGHHIRRMNAYAALLGRAAGCTPEQVEHLRRYAGLHDVGKVGIRDAILKKPGPLTEREFEEMKAHTLIGAEILQSAGLPEFARNIALHHHERWDGTGYPFGVAGERIPLEARIISVGDVFDALVSERCYKPAFNLDEARKTMESLAGSHLDPTLVRLFFANIDSVLQILEAYRDQGVDEEAWG